MAYAALLSSRAALAVARCALSVVAAIAVTAWLASAPAAAADKAKAATEGSATVTPVPPSTVVEVAPSASSTDSDTPPSSNSRTHRRARVHIDSGDADLDSFDRALQTAPWLVGLIFMVVSLFFVTPIVVIIGIIWYKLRKTRLQNEALVRLAEKGVMPPAQAVDAVVSGMPVSEVAAQDPQAPSTPPIGGMVTAVRKRAAWSDLRKGVLMAAFGLSFIFYSMIDSAEPNWLGLALLFVGAGYLTLWWLENRQVERPRAGGDAGGGTK